jgi:hypothetical protein
MTNHNTPQLSRIDLANQNLGELSVGVVYIEWFCT